MDAGEDGGRGHGTAAETAAAMGDFASDDMPARSFGPLVVGLGHMTSPQR